MLSVYVHSIMPTEPVVYIVTTEECYGGFDLVPCEGRICSTLADAKSRVKQSKLRAVIVRYNMKTHESARIKVE